MPASTETPVKAYAHCVNSRCPGNAQVPIDAVVTDMAWAYSEQGGDGMFGHPERTARYLRFADPEQSKCEHCGGNRDLSDTPRIQLDDSGYDRGALLDIEPDLRNPESYKVGASTGGHTVVDDARATALEAENRELRERLARVEGFMLGKQPPQEPPAEEPSEDEEPED